jgi:hypothetical protein
VERDGTKPVRVDDPRKAGPKESHIYLHHRQDGPAVLYIEPS